MDIGGLKPVERTVEILHPATGVPLGIRVTICSIDDERLKKAKREMTDERLRADQKGKPPKATDIEHNAHRLIWIAARGWEWYNPTGEEGDDSYEADALPNFHGEQPDFTQRNFMAVIAELPWLSDQLYEEVGDTKAFFERSKTI